MATTLKARLQEPRAVLAPGVYDALSALLVEQAGFEAAYLSGAAIAYTQLGRSDLGLVSSSEVASVIGRIRERVDIPLIVDADTGFGNALNTQRTMRTFERAGASAIQIEDQVAPKRCGHLSGKALISPEEMAGKVRAAADARASADTLIIGRTDAIAVEGFSAALDRAELYREAGADVLFVEAPGSREQMQEIVSRFAGRIPLLANMVEGGRTPLRSLSDLEAAGFQLVITPGAMVRALTFAAQEFLAHLKVDGSTEACRGRMLDFDSLNRVLGLPDMLATSERYADRPTEAAE
ncbi:MAG: isocitrate lyase/phosphoenolpyruvate mutase family protein [Caulobacterales bacterium]|nr:isocitrate lyase/phosphoenolpyruvate mutase family protein [Caulobacterales bacterium]